MDDFSFSPDDPERGERGNAMAQALLGATTIPADSPFRGAARDFVFSEVWSRPGLDRRSRIWITLACVCSARAPTAMQTYLRVALRSGEISMAELREFVLQFAVFQGFPKGVEIDLMLDGLEAEGADRA